MRFRRYAIERTVAALAALFLAVVVVFVICHALGLRGPASEARRAANYASYVHEDFGDYLWRLAGHASLGRSSFGGDVAALSFKAATVTLSLVFWALFIGLLLAVPLGLAWSGWPRWTRLIGRPFAYVAGSLLIIWVGLYASLYLGHRWGTFPVSGYADFFDPPKDAFALAGNLIGGAVSKQWRSGS